MNKIEKISSQRTGEFYYKIQHKSGLRVFVYPKEGYKSSYGIFGTHYGSINNAFRVGDGNVMGEKKKVPDGIAHFLEHKLFESEEQDAFQRFAKTGANANAYTAFDKTCYLFSCTEKLPENLEILLDFVQSPYFTEETVKKEQGIIGQEIKMYDDSPDWRVMFNLLGALYHNHPVKIDIAGTVESIAEITAEKLYECYNTFYNLNNMLLCVCGNTTPEEVLAICDKMLKPADPQKLENCFDEEPESVASEYVEQKFPVTIELFNLGFKHKSDGSPLTARHIAEIEILLASFASATGGLYKLLMDKKLINQSFSYELFDGPGFFSIIMGGESRNPKEAAKQIREYIIELKKTGISQEDFEISKKAIYGDAVTSLNSVDAIGNMLADFGFNERELFNYIDEIAEVTNDDVNRVLAEILNPEYSALSVICG